MPLHDPDLAILREAACREDHLLVSPRELKTRSNKALTKRLLASGLATEVVVASDQPKWGDSNDTNIGLQLTSAGLVEFKRVGSQPDQLDDAQVGVSGHAGTSRLRMKTKIAQVIGLLERLEGATLDEIIEATGWLPHSTRASLTGLRKRGFELDRSKRSDGQTQYRIAARNRPQATDLANV